MMNSELRASDGRRSATYGLLLFAAVAIAMLFLNTGRAYAADTSSQNTTNAGSGAAAAASGDANASGNNSGTAAAQEGSGSGSQAATAKNSGSGSATTGNNVVTGNNIGNKATADQQQASAGNNRQTVTNVATGTARLSTGDATASGNNATTNITQKASDPRGSGSSAINQSANVSNIGTADANTGNNRVAGNDVNNALHTDQSRDELAARGGNDPNRQDVRNDLAGRARVTTGDADSTGNNSWTGVAQIAVAAAGSGGGAVAISQAADVTNHGDSVANTGRNDVFGNQVRNSLTADQSVQARGPPGLRLRGIIFNRQDVRNILTGSARVETGDASSTGNNAHTDISSYAQNDKGDAGIDQRVNVNNVGRSEANTGVNDVAGNDVNNRLRVDQSINQENRGRRARNAFRGTFAPFNRQDVRNVLAGSARLETGDADSTGNTASTSVAQEACADDGATISQSATVNNTGVSEANTGRNDVFGNDVSNSLRANQSVTQLNRGRNARNTARGAFAPFNRQDVNNVLVGRARVETGDASSTGNWADTAISQTAGADGTVHVDQSATVNNMGARLDKKGNLLPGSVANTGANNAAGNDVGNRFGVNQSRSQEIRGRNARNIARGRFIPFNRQDVRNTLVGAARLETGDAASKGNVATTSVSQTVCCEGSGHIGQHVTVNNTGVASANTGRNDVFGNDLTNSFGANQSVSQANRGRNSRNVIRGIFAPFNRQDIANVLVGRARLETGDASATGSWSDTAVEQLANVDGEFTFDVTLELNNDGRAEADSGSNVVAGNDLRNRFRVNQSIEQSGRGVRNILRISGRFTPINRQEVRNGTARNPIVGRASLETGSAEATGNVSHASVRQVLGPDVAVDCCKRAKEHKKHHKAHKAGRGGEGGGELAFTGAPLGALSLFGLLLIAVGGLLRRRQVVA